MEVVTIESKVDWNTVKAEYVAGGISQRAIAEKYGISWSTLQKRAQKEKWAKVRQAASDKIVEKTVQKAAKMNADNATLAADIKRKGLVILNNLFDDFAKVKATEHRDYKGRNLTDIKRLRDLTAAYKDLTDDMKPADGNSNELLHDLGVIMGDGETNV